MFKKIVGLGFQAKWKNRKDVSKYVKELVDWGATEFFTGYNPPYWHDKFGFEVSPNGRFSEHEQITDLETLKEIVSEVHSHGFEVFINLNAWYYTDETFPLIERMVKEFDEVWVDGIIVWNIWILEYLKEINYSWKINISTIFSLYNTEAIRFFLENYKINKVILSREITLKEIENIVTAFPEMKFEVFGEGDFCRYNNGLCFAEHKYWTRDICTIVMNDLIIKNRYSPAFKKIILGDVSDREKLESIYSEFHDIFEEIERIFDSLEIYEITENEALGNLLTLVKNNQNRVDLYYDALKSPFDKRNKNIISFLKAVKFVNRRGESYNELQNFLEDSIKYWMKEFSSKVKLSTAAKIDAEETNGKYNRNDNVNLYVYEFFHAFPNIETVKFPTRWRSSVDKLELITDLIESWKDPFDYIDSTSSLDRQNYDFTHLFWKDDWFKNLLIKTYDKQKRDC